MPAFLGQWELLALAGVVLALFGPKQIPRIARSLGRSVREAKEVLGEVDGAVKGATRVEEDSAVPEVMGPREGS